MPTEHDFEQFLTRHTPRAWRVAMSLLGNADDAEDAIQEAAVIAARKLDVAAPTNAGAWFCEIVANSCRNLRRGRRRRQARESAMPAEQHQEAAPNLLVSEAELLGRALGVLGGLPEGEKEAVTLVHLGGMTIRDAARSAGVGTTTLADRVSRGLAKLRQRLGIEEGAVLGLLPALPFAEPPSGWSGAQAKWKTAGAKALGATQAALTIGGILVSKKIIASCALLILLILAGWYSGQQDWWFAPQGDQDQPTTSVSKTSDGYADDGATGTDHSVGSNEPLNNPANNSGTNGGRNDRPNPADSGTQSNPADTARTERNSDETTRGPNHETTEEPVAKFKPLGDRLVRRIGGAKHWKSSFWGQAMAIHPHGDLLAVGGYPGSIRLLETHDGTVLRSMPGHPLRYVNSLRFNSNGNLLLSAGFDGYARVWDATTGLEVQSFLTSTADVRAKDPNPVRCRFAGFSLGEKKVVTVSSHVQVWDATSGELLHTFAPATRYYELAALSTNGRTLAVYDNSGQPELWDLETRERLHTLPIDLGDKKDELAFMEFSPTGNTLVAGAQARLFVWQTSSGLQLCNAERETQGTFEAASFRAGDGRLVVYNSNDGLQLMSQPQGEPELSVPCERCTALIFSATGKFLYVQCWGETLVLNAETLEQIDGPRPEPGIHKGNIRRVRFAPDSEHIVSSSLGGEIKYWSVKGDHLWTLKLETWARALDVLPDGTGIVATLPTRLLVVDTSNGTVRHEFELYLPSGEPAGELESVSVSPDGLTAAVGCGKQGLLLVNLGSGAVIKFVPQLVEDSDSLHWLPDGQRLIAYHDQKIYLVNCSTGVVGMVADTKSGRAYLDVSPDGKLVAASCGASVAGIWEIETGKKLATTAVVKGDYSADAGGGLFFEGFDVRFSGDGTRLVCGGAPGEIRVYDVQTGELIEHFGYTFDNLWCIDLSPDGLHAVTSMIDDESISIWTLSDD